MIQTLLIKKQQMTASRWSGGTTTQIDIFPEGSTYGSRDFLFRVSSATIEESPSQFTALPDYQRWITMLSGPVVLEHGQETGPEELERLELQPLEIHSFDGGMPTKSVGEARDFNLMLRKGLVGNMLALSIGPQADPKLIEKWLSDRRPENLGHLAVYWPEGTSVADKAQAGEEAALQVGFDSRNVLLNQGDYLRLSGPVKALKEVRLSLDEDITLLLLYMET
ncbi:HutD family protein [Acidaminobacter sp.]|uniref:HutD/Ves family protein n=1 Tax=Acidaminobacter sp. TaxID=1872102 RepID=UPI00256A0522|nr:HutD family protein [Acidaminobacter sp.]MDK9710539.1 HutD family protein [Acidaminobacter sp.]